MPTGDAVRTKLEGDRKDLLDLSLRNPLLNYRPRARGLEFAGEDAAELFRLLVTEGRALSFLHDPAAVDEPPGDGESSGEAPADAGPEADAAAAAEPAPKVPPPVCTTDTKLQTALSAKKLESRLLATYYAARTSVEEQGVNTLFLALGMLVWYDSSGQKRLRAPLVLVPVELERSSARERFRLRHDGEDLGTNLSLAEKLRAEFQIVLPELPETDELDVAAYFDAVAEAVRGQEGWGVERDAVALGFFSFGKFLMYVDLDAGTWPEDVRPPEHPILRALLADGFHEPPAEIGDDEPIDGRLAPAEARQVVDADSSQILALVDAVRGRNLVIQGPPGTGKSQTITNLIAAAVGQGKKVLFVAEKMAALEVVKRRLDAVGMGSACLELHSNKSSKKGVLAELRKTLERERPRVPAGAGADDSRMLNEVRDRLNAYCEAVNAPIAPTSVTPHRAFGELLVLRAGLASAPAPPRPELPAMAAWADFDFARRLDLVEQLQARLEPAGVPRAHPFWGSRRVLLLPSDEEQLRTRIADARRTTDALRDASARLAAHLRLEPPGDHAACEALLRTVHWVATADQARGSDVRSAEWLDRASELRELLEAGRALADLHRRHDEALIPEAWDQDLLQVRQDLATYGGHWWRFFFGAYRAARRRLAGLCRGPLPKGLPPRLALVDAVLEAGRHRETIRRHEALGGRLFGPGWQGERSDWPELAAITEWSSALRLELRDGRVPAAVLDLLANRPAVQAMESLAAGVREALADQAGTVAPLFELLQFDQPLRFGPDGFVGQKFADQADLFGKWLARSGELRALVAVNVAAGACRAEGLEGVVAVAESWPEASRHLERAFRIAWFEGLLERAYRERPALAGFDGAGQEHAVARFRTLDRQSLGQEQARLAHEHWRGLPRHDGGGQLAVLRREFEKKTRHLPVRQLMARAGNAVQAIKPVFMMSPLSVASYLPPGCVQFDLVVFDEASQVRPVDAFGALLRGRQAVVVGDSRQLPPTSFFDRLVGGDEDEESEASSDVESVLGLFAAQGAPERMLRWHYRSRHESLIAVSNHEFYDGRLVVFPSPDASRSESGLVFRHLPETSYDRGQTRSNPGEAEAVARAVLDFAREQLARPEGERLTLGVAAFSTAQMQAIVDRLERLRREEPSCEEFFAEGTIEPFFVKNLENVQGDERDVIYISVGYGRTAQGQLAMNFGPLNNEGGERRLNVLITRARRRCEVFTNLTAEDIDLNRTRARGVAALKAFLAYAQSGRLDVVAARDTETASPFEESVRSALAASGYEALARFGSAGFRLDLAVVDPDQPGRFVLGIEADGASYQSARSARDRDRLRQQVLEGLGWHVHRVWSAGWSRDPDGERKRLLSAIEEARAAGPADEVPAPDPAPVPSPTPAPAPVEPPAAEPAEVEPEDEEADPGAPASDVAVYEVASLNVNLGEKELHAIPKKRMARWVGEVVRVEGPVHQAEAVRRIIEAAGVKRVGNRIQAAFDLAVELAVRDGTVRREGAFLWPSEMSVPVVRNRSSLPASARKFDLVATEEIAAAIERVVADAFGMEPAAIPLAACRLLGFGRLSDEMRRRVDVIIEDLVTRKRLVPRGDHLITPDVRVAG